MICMHHRHPGMHRAMNSYILILTLSWNFLCADMFRYKDSEIVSVCPYPEKEIILASSISAHWWVCFLIQSIKMLVSTYICVNYMHINVSTSLHHLTFKLAVDLQYRSYSRTICMNFIHSELSSNGTKSLHKLFICCTSSYYYET